MDAIIDPSADVLWDAVRTVVDPDGVHESVPTTPQQWLDLRRAAVRIIEGANLLMIPGRAAAPRDSKSEVPGVELEPAEIETLIRKKRKTFDDFALALQDLASHAVGAIETKDAPALLNVGSEIQDVCEACHKTFWYPGEKLPPRN